MDGMLDDGLCFEYSFDIVTSWQFRTLAMFFTRSINYSWPMIQYDKLSKKEKIKDVKSNLVNKGGWPDEEYLVLLSL